MKWVLFSIMLFAATFVSGQLPGKWWTLVAYLVVVWFAGYGVRAFARDLTGK